MIVNGTEIEDTFAEAFGMSAARLIVTAIDAEWAAIAGRVVTGYATSVIGCDAEAGIAEVLPPERTPDGRPGVAILFFAFSRDALAKAVLNRVGQCLLTCPTTAVYNGLPIDPARCFRIGGALRYFGDGWQIAKKIGERRFWRIPVMDGEFLCEDEFGTAKGVAGGNFLLLGEDQAGTLRAARRAIQAIAGLPDVICPFPGGVVRSGSKVGSRYAKLKASTNDAYCPTLRGLVKSELPEGVNAVYEIVIDGLSAGAIESAMRIGIRAACGPGIVRISAGNYGGKLGPFHFRPRTLLTIADSLPLSAGQEPLPSTPGGG
jgi:formylmethanofuran--tetrahydromethanopterin N-formyltransferase